MSDTHAYYLLDVGREIRQLGEAAQRKAVKRGSTDFDHGRRSAYYEVLSLMRLQALAFGLPLADVGLEGFDAERDLL